MGCVNLFLALVYAGVAISSQAISANKAVTIDLSGVRTNNYRRLKAGKQVIDGRNLKYNGEYDYYQLHNVAESRANGSAVDVSECIICPIEGEVCPLYQRIRPRIYSSRDRVVRIPEKLAKFLSYDEVTYTASTPTLKTYYNILPGFSAMLTFTPQVSNFTARLSKCRLADKDYWFWPKDEFLCKTFHVHQLVPIINSKGNALGEFGYRGCDHPNSIPLN